MLSLASRETGKELYVVLLNGLCDVLVCCLFMGDGICGPDPWDSPIASDHRWWGGRRIRGVFNFVIKSYYKLHLLTIVIVNVMDLIELKGKGGWVFLILLMSWDWGIVGGRTEQVG